MASSEDLSAVSKAKRSPPPFYIEGILRDTKEKKEGEQPVAPVYPATLLPASTTCISGAPSRLHVSTLTSPGPFISRPFPGMLVIFN